MNRLRTISWAAAGLAFLAMPRFGAAADEEFPAELVDFVPHQDNPVFAGTGKDTWDRTIRERGYLLREGDTYHLWYTGYNHNRSDTRYRHTMSLGYATSPDGLHWIRHPDNPVFDKSWTNVQDDPVIAMGPEPYDKHAVAVNQIVKHGDRYYAYYHACGHKPWRDWTTNVAVSTDLVHWKKYPKNPIVSGDKSSGSLVHDGERYRLYTTHPDVRVYSPRSPR